MSGHSAVGANIRRIREPLFGTSSSSALMVGEIVRAVEPMRLANTDEGERQLGPYVLPPFQRPPEWTREQQVSLVESMWDKLPVNEITYNDTGHEQPCDAWLLDGQQRVTALLAFVQDRFPLDGLLYSQMHIADQRFFRSRTIGVRVTHITDPEHCLALYNKLAYGGSPHDPLLRIDSVAQAMPGSMRS